MSPRLFRFVPLGSIVLFLFSPPEARAAKGPFHEPNLCGPIAMFAVCQSFGIETSIEELSDLCGYDGFGVTVLGITAASGRLGLKATPYQASPRSLRRALTPAIIDFPRGHFSVIMGWRAEGAVIFDPPRSSRIVPEAEIRKLWGGHVVTFERDSADSAKGK